MPLALAPSIQTWPLEHDGKAQRVGIEPAGAGEVGGTEGNVMNSLGRDLDRHDSLLDGAAVIDVVASDPHNTWARGGASFGTAEIIPNKIQTRMIRQVGETYRFGPFELRPRDYALTRDGAPVRLSPKAFDTLRLLVEGHGHIVEKSALIAALWPDIIVEEANLSVQVAAVRKALRDAGGADRYIETVPKRGYRFVAAVTTVDSPGAVIPSIPVAAVTPLVTVVVVRLKILRGHPDADFLAFSLPDAIAASLADRPNIVVRSPLAAERHGGPDADLTTLAVTMQARFALTGTLTHIDGRIAVRLQLLEVPAGTVMWSESRTASIQDLGRSRFS